MYDDGRKNPFLRNSGIPTQEYSHTYFRNELEEHRIIQSMSRKTKKFQEVKIALECFASRDNLIYYTKLFYFRKAKTNMGENFYSLRILRDEERCVEALYLKQYFEFCGIYVQECILSGTYRYGDEAREKVNVNIWLLKNSILETEMFECDCSIDLFEKKINRETFRNAVGSLLQKLTDHKIVKEKSRQSFERLLEIFVAQNYAVHNFARRSFLKYLPADRKSDIAQMYYNCYTDLYQYEEECEEGNTIYIDFAKLNSARIMNEVCQSMGKTDFFRQEVLMEKAERITEQNPDFTMGKVLAGFCGIKKSGLRREGSRCLEEAIKKEEKNPCINFVRYAYGHFLECQQEDYAAAAEQYQRMGQTDPNDYRVSFKEGRKWFREKDYQGAKCSFQNVLDMLAKRKFCLPIDEEYGYKSWTFLEWIAGVYTEDSKQAQDYNKKSDEILNKLQENQKHLKEFFGTDYSDYVELISKKIEQYHFNNFLKNNCSYQ